MDDSNEDPRLPHHANSNEFVSLDQLAGNIHHRHLSLYNFFCWLLQIFYCRLVVTNHMDIQDVFSSSNRIFSVDTSHGLNP
jgi:hypothetical protein